MTNFVICYCSLIAVTDYSKWSQWIEPLANHLKCLRGGMTYTSSLRRKAFRLPVEMFLSSQPGNSTQLQVYYGSSNSKSLPSSSIFSEPARIWGFLRVPLFMMFPQVNSAAERRYFLTAHTLWWVRWNAVCFRKPCLLHRTAQQMFEESHCTSRDIKDPFGSSHRADLSSKLLRFFFLLHTIHIVNLQDNYAKILSLGIEIIGEQKEGSCSKNRPTNTLHVPSNNPAGGHSDTVRYRTLCLKIIKIPQIMSWRKIKVCSFADSWIFSGRSSSSLVASSSAK